MVEILTSVADVDLTRLFITKIVRTIMPEAEPLAKLLKTVPWETVKDLVIEIVCKSHEGDFDKWLMVSDNSGICEIANKVIELSLKTIEMEAARKTFCDRSLILLYGSTFSLESFKMKS